MKTSEIVTTARNEFLHDTELPYLWSDNYLTMCATQAEREAVRRANLIKDTSHASAADVGSGTATSTLASALIDSNANFLTVPSPGPADGKTVFNLTQGTWATVMAIVSSTQLTLSADIMVSGDSYIIGDSTQALCLIPVLANTATYQLSRKVLTIERCHLMYNKHPLTRATKAFLDNKYGSRWMNETGEPKYFIEEKGSVTLVPCPDSRINNQTGKTILLLDVFRYPIADLSMTSGSPEIDEEYHFDLIKWICFMAFSKPDSETRNEMLAKLYSDQFTERFGPPIDARSQDAVRELGGMMKLQRPRWS